MTRISSGISIRKEQIKSWLNAKKYKDEYLLISTKPDSVYSKKLTELKSSQKLIVDLYTPIFLEKELTLSKWKPQDWLTRFKNKEMVKKFLKRGVHFLVANHRQREYWIGVSKNLGVPLNENDISVFPTGSSLTINHQPLTMHDHKVVLWFGGIYPWMDPTPLIEAFSQVSAKFPDWKLRFLGGFHPDTGYSKRYIQIQSLALAKIPKSQVEFIPWQQERSLNKYLENVAFAVHLAKQTPEDYYAHRVRLLTLLEAGIPVITGGRDMISDLIDEIKAGMKVEGSVEDLTSKLEMVFSDSKILAAWKLQTSIVLKLFSKREYIQINWRKIPGDRIKNCRKI